MLVLGHSAKLITIDGAYRVTLISLILETVNISNLGGAANRLM